MRIFRLSAVRPLFRRRRYDDLAVSMREHLEEKIDELMDEGMSRREAEQAARRAFGNAALLEERSREAWQWPTAESLLADVRFALRQIRRSPGFAAIVVLTLGLGIGANTAIFTLVHAILLRSLQVSDPSRLVRVGDGVADCCFTNGLDNPNGNVDIFSYNFYLHLRETTPEFEQLAAMQAGFGRFSVRRGVGPAKSRFGEFVSGNYFRTFGVPAFAGRMLADADDRPSAAPVAVLSYAAWQADFGGDASIVGTSVRMQGQLVTVIGIAPPAFYGDRASATPPAFWLPLSDEPLLRQSSSVLHQPIACWLYFIGRVPVDVSRPALAQKIAANLRAWLMTQDEYRVHGFAAKIARTHVVLAPGGAGIQKLQQETGGQLRLLQSISALLLLVACANVANLMLGRGLRRRIEVSVRMALGSARSRLVRQMITESLVLGGLGGVAGIALAYAGTRMMLALAFPEALHSSISATPSVAVLGFACVLAILTGIAFGILPAWMAWHEEPASALRGAGRSIAGVSALPQRTLIIFQIAFSLVLLVAALMLTCSLANGEHEDIGIRADHRYVLGLDPASAGYAPGQLDALHRELETRLQALPGMRAVGLAMYSPLDGGIWVDGVSFPEHPSLSDDSDNDVLLDRVSPHFLASVGQPVVLGRGIMETDTASAPLIAVVNQAFVRKYLPRVNPIGKRFGLYEREDAGAYEIVGVVADAKYTDAQSPAQPMVFEPLTQWQRRLQDPIFINLETQTHFISAVVMNYDGPPASLEPAVRATLSGIDPNLAVIQFRTLSEQLAANFSQERLVARLASLFALLALVLTGVGLYGITSYQVAQRTREIGLRMAFGAGWQRIVIALTVGALRDLGIGLAVGIPAALLAARLVQSELYRVNPFDPASLAVAAAALSLISLLAGIVPACRAALIDPMQALRSE